MANQHRPDWPILSQQRVLKFLTSALQRNGIVSAYLFWGPPNIGKSTVTRLLAQRLLCNTPQGITPCGACSSCIAWQQRLHPDAVILADRNDTLGIDAVRQLQHQLSRRPSIGSSTVAFVERAERLTPEAANALLKTLEEPPEQSFLILTSDEPQLLPATLRSRCQVVEFTLSSEEDVLAAVQKIVKGREQSLAITRLASGRVGKAITMAQDPASFQQYQATVQEFLELLDSSFAERQARISSLLGSDRTLLAATAARLLQTWFLVLRDLLLLRLHTSQYLVHTTLRARLESSANRFPVHTLLHLLTKLRSYRRDLDAHVPPQFILENFFAHI